MKLGYIRTHSKSVPFDEQMQLIAAAGVDKEAIWHDEAPSTSERDLMVNVSMLGDEVLIADPGCLGGREADLRKVCRQLGERQVPVHCVSIGPILFTPEVMKTSHFFRLASIAKRRASGVALGRSRHGGGRPPRWKPHDDELIELLPLWHGEATVDEVRERAEALAAGRGAPAEITLTMLNHHLGPRRI